MKFSIKFSMRGGTDDEVLDQVLDEGAGERFRRNPASRRHRVTESARTVEGALN